MFHFKKMGQKGVALLMVMFTTLLLTAIALQLASETISEYQVSSRDVKQVQAYYAAEACMQISLLRVKLYQQAASALKGKLDNPTLIDFLWSFPLPWPLPLPEEMSGVDKSALQRAMKESQFQGQYIGHITPEDAKLDITDLVSPSEVIASTTRNQILEIFQSKMEEDEDFRNRYYGFNFQELVFQIIDWMDEGDESLLGGSERAYYRDFNSEDIPPNQPFKTQEELMMVHGMTNELYQLLTQRTTIYGIKGLNVNQADKNMLMSLDPQITEEIVAEILERRADPELGGPFVDANDFLAFLTSRGVNTENFQETKVPLLFDNLSNFRLECIGQVQDVQRKIIAITYDFDTVKGRLTEFLSAEEESRNFTPDELARREQCRRDKTGDAIYECYCSTRPSSEQKQCVENEKGKAARVKSSGTPQALKPGPPEIIFWKEGL
jgi:type II secretory pathway component PulK